MGQVALLCKRLGYTVGGSDAGVYPPMSDLLSQQGITLFENPGPEAMQSFAPDLVVVGNVVSRGHPEMEWLLETQTFSYCSMSELIRRELIGKRKSIVVTGTHGKSTTASLTTHLLKTNNINPGYMIGGVPKNFTFGAEMGDLAAPFVIEGDEYDTAFFDKRSKFIHYNPHVLVVNNLEFDHADIFRDLQDVQRTFTHLLRLVPGNGCIIANAESEHLEPLLEKVTWAPVLKVGESADATVRISHFNENENGSEFELHLKGHLWTKVKWSLHGMYNARNAAMAALSAAYCMFPKNPEKFSLTGFSQFQGVKRRQDVLYRSETTQVIEDFGHHPTAIRETLQSLRNRYPTARLIASFEPRSNSTCRRVFQDELTASLALADYILLAPVHRAERLPLEERLNLETVCASLQHTYHRAFAKQYPDNNALYNDITQEILPRLQSQDKAGVGPNIFVFFSNGSFGGIMPRLTQFLKEQALQPLLTR